MTLVEILVQIAYMVSIALFIIGLKRMTSPATARAGNQMAAVAMLIGVVVTLLDKNIINFELILAGVVVGSLIGAIAAKKVEMTSMPEMVALFNGVGGASSVLVALGEYYRTGGVGLANDALITVGLSILIGGITFTGSVMAFGKLKGLVSGNPITFPLQTALNGVLLLASIVATAMVVIDPANEMMFLAVLGISLLLGVLVVLPIGGADMPVVISLLNSYSGVAASAAGFVLGNKLLIVSGALVGSAGLILTIIMCKAMNRSLTNVLFGAFGGDGSAIAGKQGDIDKTIREMSAEDVAVMTAYAQRVVIVPGYGLAVAQAQHAVREVASILESKGVDVRYGIHPVAGRMPGHMNVLLAEANVPYNQLYDMDDINPDFEKTDVVLIIGANDVVNPDARENPASPIYGMPILNVDKAKATVVFKRSMNPGFAGIDNVLFYKPNNYMFFGDAKKSIQSLVSALKEV
ncbi:NAD(P)(+) transhydrogenase (Re/Si-specific) subunit beta [Limnoraphis robusta]|uniref:NAD(P) transhydrogenase subunit beta n=1 Tax=Limnoraphis robusta CCNP1315 TaxID=3110306 RepID=A0ABU5U841_9CYAN|nr:NAD(P)(+) transhydrogenase (Re/Si-specific) subunit beta [Limnoraphis robusta]MEA5523339.1 NAD(P)(+) transhydrogenase (Re/Si-specific) subunit beta [Limnoraphis robusta CCNP1315]